VAGVLIASRKFSRQNRSNFHHLIIVLFSRAETIPIGPPAPYWTTLGPSNAAFDGPSSFT
jgi:hypothetical protein